MTPSTQTISITGASGFIGKHLTAYLQARYRIQSIDCRTASYPTIEGGTCVHLAGIAQDSRWISAKEYIQVNYHQTADLYDIFLQTPHAKKFIFMSSLKATQATVRSSYVASKQMAEASILNKTLPSDKSYYILRPSIVYGKGCKNKLKYLAWWGKMGLPWIFDNPIYAVLYVENLCWFIQYIVEHDMPSGTYAIADEQAICLGDFVRAWQVNPRNWMQKLSKKFRINLGIEEQKIDTQYLANHLTQPLPFTTLEAIAHLRNS